MKIAEESRLNLVRRAGTLTALDVFGKACAFAAAIVIARVCGPDLFGALNFAQAVAFFAVMAAEFGLETYAVRAASANPASLSRVVSTVVLLRLATSVIAFATLGALSYSIQALEAVLPLVLLYGLSVFVGAFSLQWVSQAAQKTYAMGLALAGSQVIYLALVALWLTSSDRYWLVPVALVVGEAAAVGGLIVWGRRVIGQISAPFSLKDSLGFLRRSAPIGAARLLRTIAIGSDLVIVGLLLTLADAGEYSAAYKFFQLGLSALGLYMLAAFPRMVRAAHARPDGLRGELWPSTVLVIAGSVPAMILCAVFARELLVLTYGAEFSGSAGALQVMLATLFLAALAGQFRNALLANDNQHLDAMVVAISGITHVAAKVLFGSLWGVIGVAFGGLIGEAALLVLAFMAYNKLSRR